MIRNIQRLMAAAVLSLPAVALAQAENLIITYRVARSASATPVPAMSTPILLALALLLAVIAVRVLRSSGGHKVMSALFAAGAIGVTAVVAFGPADGIAGQKVLLATPTGGTATFNLAASDGKGCFVNDSEETLVIESIVYPSGWVQSDSPTNCNDSFGTDPSKRSGFDFELTDAGQCSDSPGTQLAPRAACWIDADLEGGS